MITMKDPSLTVYPNREQMLQLIQARAVAADCAERADERCSAEPEVPGPNCIFLLAE